MHSSFGVQQIDVAWRAQAHATLVFVLRQQQVLLIHKRRGLGAGKILGPGGKVEAGERYAECAARELSEEVGLTAHSLQARGQLQFQFTDGFALQVVVYVTRDVSGEVVESEEALPFWCDLTQLPFERMWADDELWLPRGLAGEAVQARFVFAGDQMQAHRLAFYRPPEA